MRSQNIITEYYFYADSIKEDAVELTKNEITHIHKVLRINNDTRIILTDGLGKIAKATITEVTSKKVSFNDIEIIPEPPAPYHLTIAIAPTKNTSRYEWFIEKATEIGISAIQPILSTHSERKHIRADRLEKVAIAAMKQSKKAWKPNILPITEFNEFVNRADDCDKYMAYLGKKSPHLYDITGKKKHKIVLIGPEGGFSPEEYSMASENNYQSVSLGSSRLRTETAGIVATHIISMKYDKD